ncbi:DUF6059 family protein [Kitasatospora kifunensis]|uniref:Uncharacterized protein n=1 Tax=Kitasatospora kifunensis TaxID=58351 RepID=A0A7W7R3Q1_KITKI|nr:DUF6059 family protein [Kitasatospora kifunensis]MBB4924850.1 hypothetical protein [Kitasatospora kifunensis]
MGTLVTRSVLRLLDSPAVIGLLAFGSFFGLMVPVEIGETAELKVLSDPGPGHPERLCPQEPLTDLERRLQRELQLR